MWRVLLFFCELLGVISTSCSALILYLPTGHQVKRRVVLCDMFNLYQLVFLFFFVILILDFPVDVFPTVYSGVMSEVVHIALLKGDMEQMNGELYLVLWY